MPQTGATQRQTPTATDTDIAAGVPMYCRDDALARFLDSVPDYVQTVYVADNGPDQQRDVYDAEWPFDLTVLHLPHDCGIGRCRNELVRACDERYLWLGDSDMELARDGDLRLLRECLENNPGLGGISGWLIEGGVVRSGARNLHRHGSALVKTVDETPTLEYDTLPFARFDFIPQCGLFRTAAFEDYAYDPTVRNSEHADFFIGHTHTDWAFASTPAVMVYHNRDIDEDYRESKRGHNHVDLDVLDEKWGIDRIVPGSRTDWAQADGRTLAERAFGLFRDCTPPRVWLPARQVLKRVVR